MAVKLGVEERVVAAMKELGFTATDAKAYVALVKHHPATGYELAARSGVPRSAVYNVLKRLEALGLVNAVQEKPAKYRPLPPEHLMGLIESRFARTLQDLRESLESLSAPSVAAVTWTAQGYDAMLDQARSLIGSATESIYASLWRREADRLAPALRAAVDRGVESILFSFNSLPPDTGRPLTYDIEAHHLEEYWPHKIILVIDSTRALIGGAEETEDNRVVVTEEPALVEMAISNLVLDITPLGQRRTIDTAEVVSSLTRHLAPVDELLRAQPRS